MISVLAETIGASDSALRLLTGQLIAYPLAFLHQKYLRKESATIQHLFFAISGFLVATWSISFDCVFHSVVCIVVTYVVLLAAGGTIHSVVCLIIWNMGYLMAGYWIVSSDEYDVNWTMPHCVLCLRLIGLAWDLYDGARDESALSKEQKDARLLALPSPLEVASHCFFIGGYFVGPQFSMRKFQAFIERNIHEDFSASDSEGQVAFGLRRLQIGVAYLVFHIIGDKFVPVSFVQSPEFSHMSFVGKCFWSSVWVKIILAKYIGCWLFSEGSCIIAGLAYNGRDEETGRVKWNGGANVKLRVFEKSSKFGHVIDGFNINTNSWVASYVYKRLKFLNNRDISQAVTLIFLACWHGFHSGYYLCFFNEFLVMKFEKEFTSIISKSELAQKWLSHPGAPVACWIVGKFYLTLFLPHCFFPFALLKHRKYLPVLRDTYALIFLFFGTWPLWSLAVKALLLPARRPPPAPPTEDDKKKE